MSNSQKRIVLATIGSLGDLHPCLALAMGLRERGHQPVIVSTELYRDKVQGLGLEFHSLRPDSGARDPEVMRKVMDMRRGPEFLLRQLILPALKETYEDLAAVVPGADLLIAGEYRLCRAAGGGEAGDTVDFGDSVAIFVLFGLRTSGIALCSVAELSVPGRSGVQ